MQASSTATTVDTVLQELRMQQETVDHNLATEQKAIDADKKLQAQLKADIGAFERAASDLAKARASAQQASDDAQRAWDAVKDQLDELDEDVKQEIDGKIGAADTAIGEKQSAIDCLVGDLGKLQDEQAQFERELSKEEAGFRSAVAELQQLPAKLNTAATAIQMGCAVFSSPNALRLPRTFTPTTTSRLASMHASAADVIAIHALSRPAARSTAC